MISALRTFGRVLWQHWPALLAWFLGGQLVHTLWVQLAGWIGGTSATFGMLLMPVAMMARLVSYVAMFLVVRDAMYNLRVVTPRLQLAADRRREFSESVLAAMIPFTAFYAAQGFLREDMVAYAGRAWDETFEQMGAAWAEGEGALEAFNSAGRGTDFGISPLNIAILILAFALRKVWDRYSGRWPSWTRPFGMYLDAVWIYLTATIIADLLAIYGGWVDSRVGVVWLEGIGTWFDVHLAPVAAIWNILIGAIGQILTIVGQPLAWLAVAGTIYQQSLKSDRIRLRTPRMRAIRVARLRYRRLNSGVRGRIQDLLSPVTDKFVQLWNVITMMFRTGPVFLAGYVLAYALWGLGAQWFRIGAYHLLGPHDILFWQSVALGVSIAAAAVTETIRVALTAATYDTALGLLRKVPANRNTHSLAEQSVAESEPVRPGGVLGNEEEDHGFKGVAI